MGWELKAPTKKPTRPPPLPLPLPLIGRLHNDALRLVIEQLWLDDHEACRQLSRTSRQLYIATVPWIYRHITINFSLKSHLRLLQRLIIPGSKLPAMVRNIEVETSQTTSPEQLRDLCLFFTKLTNLRELSWKGIADVPVPLLDVLYSKFPRATLTIEASMISVANSMITQDSHAANIFLHHPANRQLTSLLIHCTKSGGFYEGFKVDLMRTLMNCPGLTRLFIYGSHNQGPYNDLFLKAPQMFPFQLKRLFLHGPKLFTHQELKLWGEQGRWENLTQLETRSDDLMHFVGKVPKLIFLRIFPTIDGLDDIEAHLDSTTMTGSPLGQVRRLGFRSRGLGATIPWCILKKISPTVTYLDLGHAKWDNTGIHHHPPLASELRALRNLCPGLQTLSIDCVIPTLIRDRGWPTLFFFELGCFKKLNDVTIYVHELPDNSSDTKDIACPSVYRQAYASMIAARERMGIQTSYGFTVGFKKVVPWERMKEHWDTPDLKLWREKSRTKTFQACFENIGLPGTYRDASDKELKKLKWELLWKCPASFLTMIGEFIWMVLKRRLEMLAQQHRNKYNERAEKAFGGSLTLYDQWA